MTDEQSHIEYMASMTKEERSAMIRKAIKELGWDKILGDHYDNLVEEDETES